MRKKLQPFLPYLLIIIISLLVLAPQILNHAFLAGDDSIFHMNRFFDDAKQIKTGKFNYFQTNFGFQQTGRIVNALYGPIFAYFNGLLLLILHTWIRYEIVSSFLILAGSGSIMYMVNKKLNIRPIFGFLISLLYMLSNPITAWVFNQQFTGWGALLMPLLLLAGIKMLQDGDIKILRLAIPMALLLQVHVLSSLIGVLALIPFFILALINSRTKLQLMKHVSFAVIITILLTGNIWSALLDVMGTNHLMPVFPVFNMQSQAISFQSYALTNVLSPIYIAVAIITILILIFKWHQINFTFRTTAIVGTFFLWLSSALFPWNTLVNLMPNLSDTIQFPKRFLAVALTLLLLSLGNFLTNLTLTPRWILNSVIGVTVVLALGSFGVQMMKGIQVWHSADVIPKYKILMVYTHHEKKLRHAYQSRALTKVLKIVVKSSPDYLPIKHSLMANQYTQFRPYHLTHYTLIKHNHHLKHYHVKVNHDGTLLAHWYNSKRTDQQRVPLIKYRHSVLKVNGKHVNHVKTNSIGVTKLTSKHGWNHVTLAYHPHKIFKWASYVTLLAWILVVSDVIIQKRRN